MMGCLPCIFCRCLMKNDILQMQVRRLKEFGVTEGELTRYLDALLKDSEHLAAMIDNVPSVDNLDFIMESDALGHKVMDQRQGHESLLAVAGTVTLEEVVIGPCILLFYYNNIANANLVTYICKCLLDNIIACVCISSVSQVIFTF